MFSHCQSLGCDEPDDIQHSAAYKGKKQMPRLDEKVRWDEVPVQNVWDAVGAECITSWNPMTANPLDTVCVHDARDNPQSPDSRESNKSLNAEQ
jgi:hypothetical protein